MTTRTNDDGFTLIEVLVGMILLTVGALSLAGTVALSARRLTGSQDQFQASERASEAVETVFKARDNQILTWAQICNVHGATGNDGGVFLDGPQPIKTPGADGLVNTADDGAIEQIVGPGPDGILGTADDTFRPFYNFTREIQIRNISATLRKVTVFVNYMNANGPVQYVLVTYLSAYA